MTPSKLVLVLAAMSLAAVPAVSAAESGFTVSATDLRERPFFDAPSLTKLAPKSAVEILERQGGWMRVKIPGREGWVRLLMVRLDAPPTETAAGSWATRFGFGTSRGRISNPASPTVTTGIRGLSPVELENAKPDPDQVKRLQSFRATPEQAKAHADATVLTVFRVSAFDEDGKPVKVTP